MTTHPCVRRAHRSVCWLRCCTISILFTMSTISAVQAVQEVAVLGEEGVWLQRNSRVIGGDVVANVASSGPFLSEGGELTVGAGAGVDSSSSRVFGNRVWLNTNTQVFDVYTNQMSSTGTIRGEMFSPLTMPVFSPLPPIPSVTPGTLAVDIPSFGTKQLEPGRYGTLTIGDGATLTLAGGLYEFSAWSVGNSARVYMATSTEIRIAGRVFLDHNARVEPAPTAPTLTANDIQIVVAGLNGSSGLLGDLPKAASFGQATALRAKLYVPKGTLEIQPNSTATGALLGKWVILGENVVVNFEGGFGLTLGGGENSTPVAEAGPDQTVQVDTTVLLDGSASTDRDGNRLTFAWTIFGKPEGSRAALSDHTAVMPNLVVDQPGTYTLQLIVNDGG